MAEDRASVRGTVFASLFGAATAAGAYIVIPVPPVPITLQTLFLLISAGLLGGRLGALSQVVYLALGLIGLPVFAGGKAGVGVLFGPTGGYLIGFVAAAYVIGTLIEKGGNLSFLKLALYMVIGTVVVYVFGVAHLSLVGRLSVQKAVSVGVIPFLIGDAFKVLIAAMLVLRTREGLHARYLRR